MSEWYWWMTMLKAILVLTCLVPYLEGNDNIQKLPFCNPNDASVSNDLIIVSTLDGRLTAFSTENGIKAWHVETQPLLTSNLHHVELTAGGKWVRLVPSLRGTLYSMSGENIEPLPFDADQLLSSSFKYSDDLVIAGARETVWLGLDVGTGGVVYECGAGGCGGESAAAAAGRDVLVLRRHSNTVRALDPRTGAEKWNFSVAEHHVALSRRECAGAEPPRAADVAVAVAMPEGKVAVRRVGDPNPMWQQKLGAPVAGMWRLRGGELQRVDVLWEAARALGVPAAAPPSLYIGVHDAQLYIQESIMYAQQLETAVAANTVPWKLVSSRPMIAAQQETALASTPPPEESNALSLITLYGNTAYTGNHGFFLYLQETCEQESTAEPETESPEIDAEADNYHVHVHVYSLSYWWKEVVLIAVSTALLMNLMIWPRFFAPKVAPASPLPMNQEVIVVERHYERPPSQPEYVGRYETDFTPLRCLGRGGFGVVFEAKNNIDHCSYAVKRITLPRRQSKRERVLREVRALAKLEHEHIVRYFNAWLEEPPPRWQEDRDAALMRDLEGVSSPLSEETSRRGARGDSVLEMPRAIDPCVEAIAYNPGEPSKRHRSQSFNDSVSIIFDEHPSKHGSSSGKTAKNSVSASSPSNVLTKDFSSGLKGSNNADDSFIVFEESDAETKHQDHSLDNHGQSEARKEPSLDKRLERVKQSDLNETTETTKSKRKKGHTRHWSLDMVVKPERAAAGAKMYLYIQMQLCRRDSLHDWLRQNRTWDSRGEKVKNLFRQIVSAVEYVHLAGLIHRDLKPSNILFAPDGRVKVGDFGLVTAMGDGCCGEEAPPPPQAHCHTYQVGTHLYMSPEQLLGRPYGFKVDIYSLGLILFELLHPFGTEAERVACLRAVRRGHYPTEFTDNHPDELEVLRMMLSEEPSQRPSAAGVRARAPLGEPSDQRWHFALPGHLLA